MKRPLALLLLVSLAAPLVALAGGSDWKKDFDEKYASKNSWERHEALAKLDPTNKDQLKVLLEKARTEEYWYLRLACVAAIQSTTDEKTIEELRKQLKTGHALTAEVIATAFASSKKPAYLDDLVEALEKSKDWQVRRAAALGLGNLPDKKAVSALIKALDKDAKTGTVLVHVLDSLERVTNEKDKKNAKDWKDWWTGAEPDWAPGAADAKRLSEAEEDKRTGRIRTVCRGTSLDLRSRGKGTPLLVLPEYGYEKDYLETYLRGLEEKNQVLYLKLPGINDFNPQPQATGGKPAPDFPIDRVVDSLEQLRQDLIKAGTLEDKPFAIFGHGLMGWVAIRYAWKHPKGVRRLVLCSTYATDKSALRDIEFMAKDGRAKGDAELEHVALNMIWIGQAQGYAYNVRSKEEGHALTQKLFTSYFANAQDLEIGRLLGELVPGKGEKGEPLFQGLRNMGGCFVPAFDVNNEKEINVPTLILCGEHAYMGTPKDAEDIVGHYRRAKVQVFPGCSRMFFAEDPKRFQEVMERHLH